MRPLIFFMTSLAPTGGIERDAIKCFKSLVKQGRKLHIAVAFLHPDIPPMFEGDDITWHRLKTLKRPPAIGQWWLWRQGLRLEQKIKQQHPDALSLNFEWLPIGDIQIGGIPRHVWWQARKQMGLSTWNRPAMRLWGDFVQRQIIQHNKRIVVYSNMAKEAFLDMGLPAKNIARAIVPTNLETFSPVPEDLAQRQDILLIGADPKLKGIDLALKAWPSIHAAHPQMCLNIVCKGWKVPRLVEQLQLPAVTVSPLVTDPERYYQRARLLWAPSFFETWGNVVPEALASGVPVVTSQQTPSSELVSQPELGRVISRSADSAHDAKALVAATLELLQQQEGHDSMRNRHEHVAQFQNKHEDIVAWITKL